MMKIYIAIWDDRNSEPEAYPFSDLSKAIKWARIQAEDSCSCKEDYRETDHGDGTGEWKFYIVYSRKGDCIYIVEKTVDEETNEGK